MRFCSTQLQTIEVASKSDPYKKYPVELRPTDSIHPKCACMAWIMARNRGRKALGTDVVNADVAGKCKHLPEAWAQVCDWEGADATFEDGTWPCPKCGADTVEMFSSDHEVAPVIEAAPAPAPVIGMPELRPMLAEEVDADQLPRYIADDGWWAQQKVDGHRVLIHVQGGKVKVLGRSGQISQHGARFTQPAYADITRLPDCVIDGELVGDVLWLFDLPYHVAEGIDTESPYHKRQDALERTFHEWNPGDRYRLVPTARTPVEKGELALTLLKTRAEGVMLKDVTGAYQPGGRVRSVLKAKYVKEVDVFVTKIGEKGHDSYTLAVFRNGKEVEVGKCSAIGKATCVKDDVITVRFLYLAENDRLYQPRMIRKRDDKAKAECDWAQLAHAKVNKSVRGTLSGIEAVAS